MTQLLILIGLFLSIPGLGMAFHTAFESFSCGVKAGGLFHFVLAVKSCCCSGSFKEVEVPSFGLVASGVDADVIAAKEFCKIYNKIFSKHYFVCMTLIRF